MTSPPSVLAAAPTFRSVPPSPTSAGQEAIELAASAGLVLDPWQADVLHGALGERADGKWSAFEVGLIVPRQNGKGSILEARELAGLFLFEDDLILHSAHEFKTAAEAFRRLLRLIQDTPDLDSQVAKVRTSHGDEGIELKGGRRIRFVARSTGSGRGFTGDCVILDESYNLPGHALEALMPTMAARSVEGNPQIWYTSSAPLPREESDTLRRLCHRGRAGEDERLAYFEWACDPTANLDDPDEWARANPGHPVRIGVDFIRSERGAMSDEGFARERMGIWRDGEGNQVISDADWSATELDWRPDTLTDPVTFGLDVTPDRSRAAIAAASTIGETPAVEVVDHHRGTAWVVERLAQLTADHPNRGVLVDARSAAGNLIEKLTDAGVAVVEVSTQEHQQACGDIYDDVTEHRLRHLPQPELEAAVMGASQRSVGDAWLWDRRKSGVDISPLVSVTLALWGSRRPIEEEPQMAAPDVVLL